MSAEVKKTALYCRLSKDDDRAGESMSIENQKAMLIQYAKEHGLVPFELYVDDGYSGLNFERPGFQKMMDDIVAGKIGTVVTKDLSRLGRDHLKVGQYTEIYFPTHNIRYVAVYDGVDTSDEHSSDFAAIKNVMNEFYSRDNSRKIKASIKVRSKEGKYRTTVPPYGYLKDPEDHNHLIPDPETAGFVRKIYELVLKGWGNHRIRDYLREARAPIPSWLHTKRGWIDKSSMFPDEQSKYIWRPDTLRNLIRNRVYCGDTVNGKTSTIFKTKKHTRNGPEDWTVVEDTHEPLISRDTWERANRMIEVRRRDYKEGMADYQPTLFRGLLKCYDCGYAMSRRRYGSRNGRIIYVCGRYATYGALRCSQHKLFEDDLVEAVKQDINEKAQLALADRDRLVSMIMSRHKADSDAGSESAASVSRQCRKRLDEIDRMVDQLYEDHVMGVLSDENYRRMMEKYQSEQKDLREDLERLEHAEKEKARAQVDSERLADLLADYGEVDVLTSEMLNMLIDRIEVHEAEIIDGTAYQQLDIYYRFVGMIDETEYASTTFYKSGAVVNASKKRAERHRKERTEAAKAEI